jgi:hypothetical protein
VVLATMVIDIEEEKQIILMEGVTIGIILFSVEVELATKAIDMEDIIMEVTETIRFKEMGQATMVIVGLAIEKTKIDILILVEPIIKTTIMTVVATLLTNLKQQLKM